MKNIVCLYNLLPNSNFAKVLVYHEISACGSCWCKQ